MKLWDYLFKALGKAIIKVVIATALVIIPVITCILKIKHPEVINGRLFVIFIFFLAVERTWETFYSSKDRKRHKLYGDWTLAIVSIAYIILIIIIIFEFFMLPRSPNKVILLLGVLIYIFSFVLRLWGMLTLKDQWSVHAVGAKKVKEVFLIRSGPYKYVRHPIYLGVIGEVMSIPLIWNTFFSFVFACLVNIPLQIIRAYLEEKSSIRKLGQDYLDYKQEVGAFLPLRIFGRNKR